MQKVVNSYDFLKHGLISNLRSLHYFESYCKIISDDIVPSYAHSMYEIWLM